MVDGPRLTERPAPAPAPRLRDEVVPAPVRGPRTVVKVRRWRRRLVIVVGVLLTVAVALAGGGYAYYKWRFSQIHKVALPSLRHRAAPVPSDPFNVLMIGSDTRTGLGSGAASHFGTPEQVQGQRSDVIMILHVVPGTQQASLLSIPRDLFVAIPGTGGSDRINSAFESGPDLLVQTIQQDLGIPIDHYMELNFNGFQNMVDAIGGINMSFPDPAKDAFTGLDITQTGCQHLDGAQALSVARSRHYEYYANGYWQYDGTSDFGRILRQHQLVRAAIQAAEGNIFNPIRLNAFVGATVNNLTIDTAMTSGELLSLLESYKSFASQKLATYTLPTTAVNGYENFGDVLFPQKPQDDQVIVSFLGESPPPPAPGPGGLTPKDVSVNVLNGAGTTGLATAASNALANAGFTVTGEGDASTFGVQRTYVRYAPGHDAEARLLAGAMAAGPAQIEEDSSLAGSTVVLVLGSDYTGVTAAAVSTSTTAAGPPVTEAPLAPFDPSAC